MKERKMFGGGVCVSAVEKEKLNSIFLSTFRKCEKYVEGKCLKWKLKLNIIFEFYNANEKICHFIP